jgi:cephalosporin hydroxylase
VRTIVSSYAFALGLKGISGNKLTMIDPESSPNMPKFLQLCEAEGVNAEFLNKSDLLCPLIKADLLFIDTWHVYGQLKRELARWHSFAGKYIIMHDTTVDEWQGETIRMRLNAQEQSKLYGIPIEEINKGLWPAVEEFLTDHPEWKIEKRLTNNNGLTILKRV